MHFASAFEQAEHGYLARCTAAAPTFAHATEIAFVDLDLAAQFGCFVFKSLGDHLPQLVVKKGGRMSVHPGDFGRAARRRARNEMDK
jgi:hypothetical protein